MQLPGADKMAISGLLRADVAATVYGLKPFIESNRWVGAANNYASDIVRKLRIDPPDNNVKRENLAQYIAASSVLHAADGWSYLGRSISCLLSGDAHRALHLAYYAELRACMSLLAGTGVGIFDHTHYVVTTANQTRQLDIAKGTHQVAWLALEHWSKQPASGMLFTDLVRPEGISLRQWFSSLGGGTALAAQARDWFSHWGMDLHFATKDRAARNESSYRPDGIPASWEIASSDVFEFTRDLWETLEPTDQSSFEQIDKSILRMAVERHFTATHGAPAARENAAFVAMVKSVVADQSLHPSSEQRWEQFLLRVAAPDDPLIFSHSSATPANNGKGPLAVISRAVLLLRVATGSANDLLKQASFDAGSLAFWWGSVGLARGLWRAGAPPEELTDLYADIRDALIEVEGAAASDPEAMACFNRLNHTLGGQLATLCSQERVGLWGLCPA